MLVWGRIPANGTLTVRHASRGDAAMRVASRAAALCGGTAHGAAGATGVGRAVFVFVTARSAGHRPFQVGVGGAAVVDVGTGQAADFGTPSRRTDCLLPRIGAFRRLTG